MREPAPHIVLREPRLLLVADRGLCAPTGRARPQPLTHLPYHRLHMGRELVVASAQCALLSHLSSIGRCRTTTPTSVHFLGRINRAVSIYGAAPRITGRTGVPDESRQLRRNMKVGSLAVGRHAAISSATLAPTEPSNGSQRPATAPTGAGSTRCPNRAEDRYRAPVREVVLLHCRAPHARQHPLRRRARSSALPSPRWSSMVESGRSGDPLDIGSLLCLCHRSMLTMHRFSS